MIYFVAIDFNHANASATRQQATLYNLVFRDTSGTPGSIKVLQRMQTTSLLLALFMCPNS